MVEYLSKEEIVLINTAVTDEFGQKSAVQQEANLDYVLESIRHYGEDSASEEERLVSKCALLCHRLAYSAHVFIDGNKRTSLISMILFLFKNGYEFRQSVSQPDRVQLICDVAQGKKSVSSIRRWLKGAIMRMSVNRIGNVKILGGKGSKLAFQYDVS